MDHYSILGLSPSATKDEVKAAFRKHALQLHPDLHINSPEAVKKNSEAAFKAIKAAYEAIEGANFIYRDARSPGRAGFRRASTYYDPSASYYNYQGGGDTRYTRPGYMHFSQRMAAEMRFFWRAFTSSGSASITAALGGLFIGGILFLEPVFSSAWERHNEGKLFKHIEGDVIQRKKAQLLVLQKERAAREAAAAAVSAAAPEVEVDSNIFPENYTKDIKNNSTVGGSNDALSSTIDQTNQFPVPQNNQNESSAPCTTTSTICTLSDSTNIQSTIKHTYDPVTLSVVDKSLEKREILLPEEASLILKSAAAGSAPPSSASD